MEQPDAGFTELYLLNNIGDLGDVVEADPHPLILPERVVNQRKFFFFSGAGMFFSY